MPIDWFTVLAQALNFLVLIWLLKRLLYRPVLAAIDARERAVAAALADADAAREQARSERDGFQLRSAQLEQQRAALLQQACAQAEAEGRRLLDQARREADAVRAAQQSALLADASQNAAALALRAQREVFAIARKVLSDLAGVGLEESVVAVFLRQLETMPAPQRTALAGAIRGATAPGRMRSAFALPQALHDEIEAALGHLSGVYVALQYDTAPDLLGGIELTVGDQRLDWNIGAYLASWQETLIALPVVVSAATQPQQAGSTQQRDQAATPSPIPEQRLPQEQSQAETPRQDRQADPEHTAQSQVPMQRLAAEPLQQPLQWQTATTGDTHAL